MQNEFDKYYKIKTVRKSNCLDVITLFYCLSGSAL